MIKSREGPCEDSRHCKALKYAEKVTRILDERYFDAIAAAYDAPDEEKFVQICKNDLGLSEDLARDLWTRICLPAPPTEHW